jgi:hypothetical protein
MGQGGMEEGVYCIFHALVHEYLLLRQVVVCIVADGRLKINPRTRSVIAALGAYQDGPAKNVVNGKPVVSLA